MAVKPIQTFYVPLPQEQLYQSLSTVSNEVQGDMRAAVGIAIAAPGTIVYYDHWEDGYEIDVTQPTQSSTQIWGDGDLTNGVAPGTTDDLLSGGQVINLINSIEFPRNISDIYYDGGDRIQASFPIAVTTGSFVEHPGSYLAGASEVFDTASWGTAYTIPVGEDTVSGDNDPFEYTAAYIMAGADNTVVTIFDAVNNLVAEEVLSQGENLVYRVGQGYRVESTKPVQAQLITGDINEQYEMRWYSLTPDEDWANEYYAPVAEEVGSTGFWFYNPNGSDITIRYDRQGDSGLGDFVVAAGDSLFIEVDDGADIDLPNEIGEVSGLRFYSVGGETFFAISQIDADDRGATFDWGTRLLTPQELTPQILVGLGFGNSTNNPQISSRSVVWVTPVADAIIHVDFDGDGVADAMIEAEALQSIRIDDDSSHFAGAENDQDMSGATIWATAPDGITPVRIAAAWGQDPSRSQDGDTYALDLGTLIPPLPGLTAAKSATLAIDLDDDGRYDPGDTIEYTITVLNFTRVEIPAGGYSIVDFAAPVFDNATYVAGSTTYTYATAPGADGLFGTADDVTTTIEIPDNDSGTPFPLDDTGSDGFDSTDAISGYERQTFTFRVQIKDFDDLAPGTTDITNTGALRVNEESIKTLEVDVPLDFEAAVEIVKYTNGQDANVFSDVPIVLVGSTVTWTYEVTNTGNVYLANVVVVDDNGTPDGDDDFSPTRIDDGDGDAFFQPGETWVYEWTGPAVLGVYRNVATVTGDPVYADGTTAVPGLAQASDSDPSAYLGVPDVDDIVSVAFDKQAIAVNGVPGASVTEAGDVITYEIVVFNDGDVPLPFINVQDPLLAGANGTLGNPVQTGGDPTDNLLNVGETWTYTGTYTVQQSDMDSRATREPDDVAQDIIDNTATLYIGDIVVTSASAQVPVVYAPGYTIEKRVTDVAGNGPDAAGQWAGDEISYEIVVRNTGNVTLTGVAVSDPLLQSSNGTLSAPIESIDPDGDLQVGETWTYAGTYTLRQIDLQTKGDSADGGMLGDGDIDNTATAGSDQLPDISDSASVALIHNCSFQATKRVVDVGGKGSDAGVDNPGETITYEIVIINTGNLNLTGVVIDDPLLDGPNGAIGDPVESMNADGVFEVGEVWTYTGSYTVSAVDYYSISWRDGFAKTFIRNVASFETDEICTAVTNLTRTPLFSGEIICGTFGRDRIDGKSTGDMRPTESRDMIMTSRGDDYIDGLGGNDWLNGGAGRDKLKGGEGNDSFVFTNNPGPHNRDKILDFKHGEDRIVLDSRKFVKLGDAGPLNPEFFAKNKAKDGNDYIIYDTSSQKLFYDKNGDKSGGLKIFAKLKGDIGKIDAGDFFVV